MSSYYDDASLMLLASGGAQKDGKVYSVKPTDGSGDFTFSRGSNLAATRVDAAHLIEKGRENLLLQSNSYDTTWALTNSTLTSNQSGYDGSNDAWLFTATSTSNSRVSQTISGSGVQTFSVYAKANTSNFVLLNPIVSGTNPSAYFDIQNGALGTTNSAVIDSNIQSVGSGWYRCSISYNDTNTQLRVHIVDADNSPSVTNGNTIYIQSAQLESGLVSTDYITSGATTGKAGILENTPRFNYGDGASCPSLLLEPSATQLLPQSEYFGSSDWDKTANGTASIPVLTYGVESPEGLNNAYEITFNTGAGTSSSDSSVLAESISGQSAGAYTLSFYAKVTSGTNKIIARSAGGSSYTTCNLTSSWKRFEITETLASSGIIYIDIGLRRGLANEPLNSSVTCQIYGANLTKSSYATSYIPTYGTSVTRAADVCGGAGASATFNDSEGVLYLETKGFTDLPTSSSYIQLSKNGESSATNSLIIQHRNNGFLRIYVNGFATSDIHFNVNLDFAHNHKIAVLYKLNGYKLFIDGVAQNLYLTPSQLVFSGLDNLSFDLRGALNWNGNVKQLLVFNTALSDLDLAILTGATTYNTFAEMAVALNYTVYE